MVHRLNGDCHWISSTTERISVEQIAYLFSIWNGRDALLNETLCVVCACVACVWVYKILYKCYYYDECDSEKFEWRFSVYYGIAVCDSFIIVTYYLKSYGAYCLAVYANRTLSIIVYLCNGTMCACVCVSIMLWLIE